MSEKIKKGEQLRSLPEIPEDLFQVTMDLSKNDDLITQRGVQFVHWAALPSPIGLKERGDYRRSDQYDTISSNGMLYRKAGCFTAAIVNNSKSKRPTEGGIFDYSTARLVVPRYYDNETVADGKEIHLAPGDRVYIKDMEVLVTNYQMIQYNPEGLDRAQFPINCVEFLIDSKNIEYKAGYDFKITDGHIEWISGKKNPGIDTETGKGRVYSVRYKYNAHWYIVNIPNEVRVSQGTVNGQRVVQRMPYSAIIQREYVYYNQNNDSEKEIPKREKKESRVMDAPKDPVIQPENPYAIKVEMSDIE
jgi:hypothetical protein